MPVVVVWYRDSAGKLLQPEVCTCAMCGASLCRNSFMTPMKLGLAKEHLFHTILPVAQCSKCKKNHGNSSAQQALPSRSGSPDI